MNAVRRSSSFRKGLLLIGMVFFVALVPSLIGSPVEGVAGDSWRATGAFPSKVSLSASPAVGAPLQSGGNFEIKPSVIAGGGGTSINGNMQLDGTIGQSVLGLSSGGVYSVAGGFWQSSQAPSATFAISGAINYCAASTPTGAANTTVNLTGDASATTSTGGPPSTGAYSFTNLAIGSYVVTPTKSGAATGITSFDAGRVQLDVLNPGSVLTACQRLAGDVNQNSSLTSFDAGLIQQYVLNVMPPNPSNHTGEWRFNPPSRTYVTLLSDQTNQNFDALLLGETNGNWTPAGPTSPSISSQDRTRDDAASSTPEAPTTASRKPPSSTDPIGTQAPNAVTVALPNATVLSTGTFTLPITATITAPAVISFDLIFTFNPAVVGFQATAVSATGLTTGWSVGSSFPNSTTLQISGFGPATTGTGNLVNLNFTRVGAQGTSTPLTWVQANFDDNPATAQNGNLILGPTAVEFSSCQAVRYDSGVFLNWQTGFEAENLGFNIYRDVDGQRTLVNPDIIAGSALIAGTATRLEAGQSYGWWDSSGTNRNAQYWIEEIDLSGLRTMHGPFGVRHVGGKPPRESQAELLSQVGRGEPRVRQLPLSHDPGRGGSISPQAAIMAVAPNLAAMPALKMTIREEGWYRVTLQELIAAGFDTSATPRNLQLFLNGVEQPMRVAGEQRGRLESIEFFATAQDKATTDAHVYWLINGDAAGSRIGFVNTEGKSGGAGSFPFTVERRDRTVYFSSLRNGDAENFFGQVISSKPVDQTLTLRHLDTTSADQAEVEIALQGVTEQAAGHSVRVLVNGAPVGSVAFSGQTHKTQKFAISRELLKGGDNVVTLVTEVAGSVSLVDYIRVTYPHMYASDGGSLRMSVASESQTIDGFSDDTVRVFDLTDPSAPIELAGRVFAQGGSYAVTVDMAGQGTRTLLALTDNRIKSPASITLNEPSNLRAKKGKANLLIIARREFFDALEPLRALRESQGLRVRMVDIADVFDEFSNGESNPQAIRDFLSFAATTWKKKPSFVLFAGQGSLDPRNYLGFGDGDIVPTKLIDTALMETASDDWFVDFNDDGLPELAVGRLPFRTQNEAATMVSKILSYERSNSASEALLVADANDGFDFEAASGLVGDTLPAGLKINRVERGRVDAASAKTALIDAINRGQKIVNYMGHGSVNQWKGDLLTNDDARGLTNDRLSLFVMMTCLNGYFQDAALDSLAEALLKAERGGAVAVWTSSGMTGPGEQAVMNQQLYKLLFAGGAGKGQALRLGEAIIKAKATTGDADVRRTWVLLGDPAMRIK